MGFLRKIQDRISASKLKRDSLQGKYSGFKSKSSFNLSLHRNNNSSNNTNNNNNNNNNNSCSSNTCLEQRQLQQRLAPSIATFLPSHIIAVIFSYLCPHANDETYLSSEESLAGNGCPLCNSRNLANASRVSKRWRAVAQRLLYQNLRLEQVHFCELEEELWRRRNRRSFFSSGSTDSNEPVKTRMRLLYRTIQENEDVANTVRYVKAPFWVREGCKQELTLLVSLLPNLQYVDLPQAVTQADSSCQLLATLKSRCSNLRVMEWRSGAETSFTNMSGEQPWPHLEEIILSGMKIDDAQLLSVLHTLPKLRSIKLEDMTYLTDGVFGRSAGEEEEKEEEEEEEEEGEQGSTTKQFPPVKTLIISECPKFSINGLRTHLFQQQQNPTLENLSLIDSGMLPDQLNTLLSLAPVLQTLTIHTTVSKPCPQITPTSSLKHLTSSSLKKIHYEILNSESAKGLTSASPSYYTYIADSLCTGHLPSLQRLYVNEVRFAVRLWSNCVLDTQDYIESCSPGRKQKCDVYCKGPTETTWKWYRWICIDKDKPLPPPPPDMFLQNPFSSSSTGDRKSMHSKSLSTNGKSEFLAGKLMSVVDMEPLKTYAAGRGFLALPAARREESAPPAAAADGYGGSSAPPAAPAAGGFLGVLSAGERPVSRKERKRDRRRSLNDTYGMGAEYY